MTNSTHLLADDSLIEGLSTPQKVVEAVGWGLLSALSLLLGCYIGIRCLPSQRVRSFFMAFGGGALLEALSIELFGEILNRIDDGHDHGMGSGLAFVAAAGAITGGLLSEMLNRIIENKGGFLRKYATAKSYIGTLRHRYHLRVARRLRLIPMLKKNFIKKIFE